MMPATVVVVGGGVAGLSTAYHLARTGNIRVVLLEKERIGHGASSRAAGIITGLLWDATGVRARRISLDRFEQLSRELEGYAFQQVGCLNLFDPASWPEREALLPLYRQEGVAFEILDAGEMSRRWPMLRPHPDWIGLLDPRGGYSEPDAYLPALAAGCRRLGVEIREGSAVQDLLLRNGRVAGVVTGRGSLEAEAVVSTVHVWSAHLLAGAGLRFPVKAFVHQRYVSTPVAGRPVFPAVNANPLGGYIRPAAGGRVLVGVESGERLEMPVEGPSFRMDELDAPAALAERASDFRGYAPMLEETSWAERRVGLIAFSRDGSPILGPVAALPGLYLGLAFHSGGFAYNPAAGYLLAQLITQGQAEVDLAPYAPERFDAAATDAYLAHTIAQQDAVARRH